MTRMALAVVIVLGACGSDAATPHVLADYRRAHLYDAPFPADDLRVGATIDVAVVPDPQNLPTIEKLRSLLVGNDGFATTGAVFFQISEPLDPTGLPDLATSATAAASAFLVGIDPAAPDFGTRYPLEVTFAPLGSLYGAPNLVALVPVQGTPLRPHTAYAAVLTTDLHAASGAALAPISRDTLDRYPDAIAALATLGVARDHVAGLTMFTTGDPFAQLQRAHAAALARPLPVIDAPFAKVDTFPDFCVYHTTIAMPDWQTGTPPYETQGGTWELDASGAPIFQRSETANLVVTIPRRAAPTGAGYPLVVFSRTGGGGDRPLVDRGQQPGEAMPAIVPGEGPARYLARAGFAGIEVDGPLGGLRNTTGGDEQFLTFNVTNLGAMRDNIRESAIELDVIAHVGVALTLDTSACGGADATATFDPDHVAIMGHSMGAWIAPIAAATEPLFRALILSGAGGSWIENIMFKKKPVEVASVIASIVHDSDLRADDPILTFAQWALEPADPQIYGRSIIAEPIGAPRHVLMVQGIVDDYILPRIANATSLSIGLDLAGPELDTEADPRLADQLPIGPLLGLPPVRRAARALPVTANVTSGTAKVTAVVTQHLEDGLEDGHEVLFQTDVPKHQYQCFLASWIATEMPTVPTDATRDAPCP